MGTISPRRPLPEIVLGLLLGIIFCLFTVVALSGHGIILILYSIRYMDEHEGFFVGFFTIVLALATIALWRKTSDLHVSGENQLKLAGDTSNRQLRAYVCLDSGSVEILINNISTHLMIKVNLKNYGQTPAYHFATWIDFGVFAAGTVPFTQPTPIELRGGSSITGPGGQASINRGVQIERAKLDGIRSGTEAIFIWGGADYLDAFGKSRYFMFRCSMSGAPTHLGADNGILFGWALGPHRLGYESDESP